MNKEIDFEKEFPVIGKFTYLNTASSGLLPRSVAEWRQAHDNQFVEQGSLFRDAHKEHIWEVKKTVANFFNARKEQVALIPNISFGLNTLLEGIPKGKKVLLIEGDYPSINWAVESRDFEIQYVPLDEQLETSLQQVFDTFRPDFFFCSLVQYISGIRIDLSFLKAIKAAYPETLLVGDGTQYLGIEPYDFTDGPFDVIGASAYKWLISGYGNGFLILNPKVEERIAPRTIGFNSADAVYGNKDTINLVGRLEPGHQDTLNYGSMAKSLEFLNSIGLDKIKEKNDRLVDYALNRFTDLNWLESYTTEREKHSTIFNIKGDMDLFMKLKQQGIITSPRGKGLRVSMHFYNSPSDIDMLINSILALK